MAVTAIFPLLALGVIWAVMPEEEGAIAQLSLHELEDDHANRSRFT